MQENDSFRIIPAEVADRLIGMASLFGLGYAFSEIASGLQRFLA